MLCRVVIILILSCQTLFLAAQNRTGTLIGHISSEGLSALPDGGVVKLTNATDTLFAVIVNGEFLFKRVSCGKATISIRHLNFETYTGEAQISEKELCQLIIKLTEKKHQLDEVTVLGIPPKIIISGDTIRFNAAAVKLMEGDETLAILKQMPGVEISESGISILGQNVARTYVDGRLTFGEHAMSAVLNLPASDVVSIKTYEEFAETDSTKRLRSDNKVRVMDIKTKSKLIAATNAHFLASLGHDIDKSGETRYGVGATANFFSEKLLLGTNVFLNNINRNSNKFKDLANITPTQQGENKIGYANFSIVKNWGKNVLNDNIKLDLGYTFNDSRNTINNYTNKNYFPTENYNKIWYSDVLNRTETNRSHGANMNFSVKKPKIGTLSWMQLNLSSPQLNSGAISFKIAIRYNYMPVMKS